MKEHGEQDAVDAVMEALLFVAGEVDNGRGDKYDIVSNYREVARRLELFKQNQRAAHPPV